MSRLYRSLASVFVLVTAFVLSGCELAAALAIVEMEMPDQRFIRTTAPEPDTLIPVKNIALLDVPNPRYYLWCRREARFTADGNTEEYGDFDFSAAVQRSLREHLEARGYRVIPASVIRDNRYELLHDYSQVSIPGADAFLDVAPVTVGYKRLEMRGPFTRKVGPHLSVVVRLIAADSREILFAESIQYGVEKNPLVGGARIDSPAENIFSNKDVLSAQKQQAVEYLVQGVDAVAQVIAGRFSQ